MNGGSAFLRELLLPEGMRDGRAALIEAYEWFTHARVVAQFDHIKANGIPLAWPDGAIPPPELLEVLGPSRPDIICLSVYPKTRPVLINKAAPMFKMGLCRDALPNRVGVDCTFGGTYELAARKRADNPKLSRAEIFLETVRDREVVISFDTIPADALRVCSSRGLDAPPAEWPRLVDTKLKDVALFKPDLVGNVAF